MFRHVSATLLTVSAFALAVPNGAAQITIDGTLDSAYGQPISVQKVQTQFGDSQPSAFGALNGGSELNAAYATVQNDRLFMMFTGNLEFNFNKLNIFFDSRAGGENTLSGTPQYDFSFDPEPADGSDPFFNIQNMEGFTFDSGFTADFHLLARGGFNGTTDVFDLDFIDRAGGTSPAVPGNLVSLPVNAEQADTAEGLDPPTINVAGTMTPDDGPDDLDLDNPLSRGNISGPALTQNLDFAFDNANVAGVTGGTEAADQAAAEAVTTGLEFSIALADLGIDPVAGGQIKVSAFINGSNHDFASNQFLGALEPPQGNLGSDGEGNFVEGLGVGGVDLNNFLGDQFFTIDIPGSVVPGDLNGDGVVDGLDIDPFVQVLTGGSPFNAAADLNGDGVVDGLDIDPFVQVLTGGSDLAIAAIPEPTTAALLALGGLGLARRRRSASTSG